AGDAEGAEDHRHHEHVVHGQRLLDQEAGVELHGALRAQLQPHPHAEQHAHAEVAAVQQQAFAHLDFTVVAVQHAQVEDQQGQHDDEKAQPEPGGSSQEGGCQKVERMHRSRSEEHTSELQSRENLVCRLLLEKKKEKNAKKVQKIK